MKMSKKNATVTLALTFGLTYTSIAPTVTYASPSLSDINNKTAAQKSLQDQLSKKQQTLQKEIQAMNKQQLKLTGDISEGQAEINQNNDKVNALKEEINIINQRIEKRKGLLKNRLVSIYKNGGSTSYLEVLLGSKSFGDFIDRAFALKTITAQDQKIITDQKNDQQAVQAKKASIEKKQAANVARLEKLKKTLSEVVALQEKKKIASDALSSKQADVSAQLASLNHAAENIKKVSVAKLSYNNSKSAADNTSSAASNGAVAKSSASASSQPSSSRPQSVNLSASVSSGGISGIISYGNKFIGHSEYVLGASDPSTGRFDCSGFVHAAFAANGIGVGRTTSTLVNQGHAVSFSQARPGDLVFFDTYKTNGHVGIYLGGGRFIGSQSSTGVAVASMSNSYWNARFHGVVRRILD